MENSDYDQKAVTLGATASVTTPDLELDPTECVAPEPIDPCTIVIVGATGDLTARKLIPALFHLYLNDGLPQTFQIVGCARTRLDDNEFRNKMESALIDGGIMDPEHWPAFSAALHYQPIDYEDLPSYNKLAESLKQLDASHNTRGNRIFYIALPPVLIPSRGADDRPGRVERRNDQRQRMVSHRRGKTFRHRLGDGDGSGPQSPRTFQRTPDFQNRPLPGQRDGSKCTDVSFCQLAV